MKKLYLYLFSIAFSCFLIAEEGVKFDTNEVYPFEINPRISTTTCLAIYCGVNIVEIFINDKVKIEKKNNLKSFKNNILLSRSWVNEFSNFK